MVVKDRTAGDLAPAYDAIVVGSGYGGGVAASRLARMGYSVAVLEQGRNLRPGDFPTSIKARRKETRLTGRAPAIGDPAGLYYLSVGQGITVFGATGLGGGSLINAGVVLRPDFDRLRKAGWPEPVVGDGLLTEGLARAEHMLGVGPAPKPERFAKYHGMKRAADAAGKPLHLPSMTIAHTPGLNAAGVMQYACRYCGDCWSGCNVGAKSTVGITYIADAVDHGAAVFCESRADAIARTATGWEVTVADLSSRRGQVRRIAAPILVLAAGTLGTVELLLRAKSRGLALSSRLGERFSANGDDMMFASELKEPVNDVAVGFPPQAPRGTPAVGPHSMALIDLRDDEHPAWVHDGTMLSVMASLAPLKETLRLKLGRAIRIIRGGIWGDELSRSQVYYIVSHDDAGGRMRLHKDRVTVDWPDYSATPARIKAEAKVKAMVERMGGVFHTNPFAMSAFGGNRVIAHPLGGASMGATADDGVVAHDGRVFDPSQGAAAVHDGLFVLDGAAIPSAVGVSPLLTITALAERAMVLASRRLGRKLNHDTAPARAPRDAAM